MNSKKSPKLMRIEPLLLRAEQAAALCGLAVSTWYSLMSSGQLPPSIKLGKARLWRLDILKQWTELDCPPIDRFTQLIKENEK
jgi:predicted DNA-binding transcriptional regulator AlpA